MMKKFKNQKSKIKILEVVFLLVVLISLNIPYFALAQDTTATPGTAGLGDTAGATGFESICSRTTGLALCVQHLYLFSLGLGAVLALLMVVLSGYRYMTAQGNAAQVESAKDSFVSAFIGLIIIFVAFILLNLINPDLVRFREPSKTLTLPQIDIPSQGQ